LTMSGDLLGTLRYMAPEQALARHGLVDHRADVYGLGCTLYELLTGRPAVRGEDKSEILRQIAFEEPTPLHKLDRAIPAELETITIKALAKNPNERYATAGELADDLRRWLGDHAIKAKPPTLRQRATKWVRRHPARAAVCGLLLLALTLATSGGVAAWQWHLAERARGRAETALDGEQSARKQVETALHGEETASQRAVAITSMHRVNLAYRAWTDGDLAHARVLLDRCPLGLRNWEWRFVNNVCREPDITLPNRLGNSQTPAHIVFSPDGRRLAGAMPTPSDDPAYSPTVESSTAWVYDLTTKQERRLTFPANTGQFVTFSPDGKWIAASGSFDSGLQGRGRPGGIGQTAGRQINGVIRLWDADTKREERPITVSGSNVSWVHFSPDSKRLVGAVSGKAGLSTWEVPSLAEALPIEVPGKDFHRRGITFSTDGRFLTTVDMTFGQTLPNPHPTDIRGWDLTTGQQSKLFTIRNEADGGVLAIGRGGKLLAQAHGPDTIRIWDLDKKKSIQTLHGPTAGQPRMSFSLDGASLAGGLSDQTVRVWDLVGHLAWA
jgi:eukaryotic-like serine/threonine-protein kinase